MEWTFLYPDGSLVTYPATTDSILDFYYFKDCLETALDFFLTSSYTYNDAEGNHIGWLVAPNMED